MRLLTCFFALACCVHAAATHNVCLFLASVQFSAGHTDQAKMDKMARKKMMKRFSSASNIMSHTRYVGCGSIQRLVSSGGSNITECQLAVSWLHICLMLPDILPQHIYTHSSGKANNLTLEEGSKGQRQKRQSSAGHIHYLLLGCCFHL